MYYLTVITKYVVLCYTAIDSQHSLNYLHLDQFTNIQRCSKYLKVYLLTPGAPQDKVFILKVNNLCYPQSSDFSILPAYYHHREGVLFCFGLI